MNEEKMEHMSDPEAEHDLSICITELEEKIEFQKELMQNKDNAIEILIKDKSEYFNALQRCHQELDRLLKEKE